MSAKPPRARGAALLGRRIALGLYWAGILYITVVGFASLIPQIFWPQPSSADSILTDSAQCASAMQTLNSDLVAHANKAFLSTSSSMRFFKAWDQRFWGLRETCVAHTDRYRDLERLRYKTEIRLAQAASDEGRIAEKIRNPQ